MKNLLDNGFIDRIFKRPGLIVLIVGILTVFFAFQLPKAELDNNNIRFVPKNDEARKTSSYIDESFGSSLFILVALERSYGDVFDAAFLNRVREFNNRVEEFEIVGNVNSIVSSDFIYAQGDSIIVEKLAAEFPMTQTDIDSLKEKLLSWELYHRSLISDDFRATQILIPLTITDEQASRPEVLNSFIEIRDIAEEMLGSYADVYVTGIPIISATINEAMRSDLITMIPLVVLTALVVLFFSFRHFTPMILPVITVLVAVIWSMGAMPLFGIKLSVVSTVLPVILVAVGSSYGIHVVIHYLETVKGISQDGVSREAHKEIVLSVIRKIGRAVFLTAITTVAGFSSFCFTSVVPIREFGFFASFGVLISYLTAVILIPSLLIIRGPRRLAALTAKRKSASEDRIAIFLAAIARKRIGVLFAVVLVSGISIWGLTKLVIDNVFVEYFKTSTGIYKSDRFIREKFGGSKIVSVMVEADTTEELLMPEVLTAMDRLGKYLEEEVIEVGKVMSFTDLVKRINQVFNADESPSGLMTTGLQSARAPDLGFDDFGFSDFGFDDFASDDFGFDNLGFDDDNLNGFSNSGGSSANDTSIPNYNISTAYYEIPADPARYGKTTGEELSQLVANYLILLSGNISSYANDPLSPTAIKSTVQLRTLGDEDSGRAINSIRRFIEANFPKTVRTTVGGIALVEASLNRLVVESQIISIIFSIVIVVLMIALINRSFMAGVVSIAPLSICVLISFAVMGFAGIKLNIGTSMMASLCVAIGIDYSIHYMEAYKHEYNASGGKGNFLLKTFSASGKAILIDAASTGTGFAVLLFSQFVMLRDLGLLIAIAMASSAVVSLTVFPVLLSLINPKFITRRPS